jgi:hypothetical protein
VGTIDAPAKIKPLKEEGHSALINDEAETKFLALANQPLQDVLTIMLDCGMRPGEVFKCVGRISTGNVM